MFELRGGEGRPGPDNAMQDRPANDAWVRTFSIGNEIGTLSKAFGVMGGVMIGGVMLGGGMGGARLQQGAGLPVQS